jgi:hypothetical protein
LVSEQSLSTRFITRITSHISQIPSQIDTMGSDVADLRSPYVGRMSWPKIHGSMSSQLPHGGPG